MQPKLSKSARIAVYEAGTHRRAADMPAVPAAVPHPFMPQPGPSAPQPGPSAPQPGPSAPQPGPSAPQPGPSMQMIDLTEESEDEDEGEDEIFNVCEDGEGEGSEDSEDLEEE
jgi:hypothetical protein